MSVSVTMGLESSEYGLSFNTGCLTYEIFNESNKGYLLAVISYRRLMKLLLYSSQRVAEGINFLNCLSVSATPLLVFSINVDQWELLCVLGGLSKGTADLVRSRRFIV